VGLRANTGAWFETVMDDCEEEEDQDFFNHYKNDLKRPAHTPSGDAGADPHNTMRQRTNSNKRYIMTHIQQDYNSDLKR